MKNTAGTITAMKRIISQVNRCTPWSKLVWALAADDALGHAAEIGAPPVATIDRAWPSRSRRWCP